MKKILNILILGVSLSLIEYIILLFCLQIENILKYQIQLTKWGGAIRHANELSLTRLALYFVFWVIAMYFNYEKVNIKHPVLKLAVVNCSLYILISVIITLFFPFAIEFFIESFFYYLVISTLISPLILLQIPFFKRISILNFNATK